MPFKNISYLTFYSSSTETTRNFVSHWATQTHYNMYFLRKSILKKQENLLNTWGIYKGLCSIKTKTLGMKIRDTKEKENKTDKEEKQPYPSNLSLIELHAVTGVWTLIHWMKYKFDKGVDNSSYFALFYFIRWNYGHMFQSRPKVFDPYLNAVIHFGWKTRKGDEISQTGFPMNGSMVQAFEFFETWHVVLDMKISCLNKKKQHKKNP